MAKLSIKHKSSANPFPDMHVYTKLTSHTCFLRQPLQDVVWQREGVKTRRWGAGNKGSITGERAKLVGWRRDIRKTAAQQSWSAHSTDGGENVSEKMNLVEYLMCANIWRGNLHLRKNAYVGISGRWTDNLANEETKQLLTPRKIKSCTRKEM